MQKPLVSVIIVNWNGASHIPKFLATMKKCAYKNLEYIIVDNGSTDNSLAMMKKAFPHAKFVVNKTNKGFAEGNNQGLPFAKGKYVLLINNDVYVPSNFLDILVDAIEKEAFIAGVQPKILMEKTKQLQAGASFLTDTGFLYHYGFGKNPKDLKYNKMIPVFSANGSCLLLRKSAIEKVFGLFDKDYFAYFEETDLCWRLWLAGYKLYYVPTSVVEHVGSQTSQHLPSTFVYYHSFKNRLASLIKNLDTKHAFIMIPFHAAICELFAFGSVVKFHTFVFFLAIQRAMWWNISNLGRLLEDRERVQKNIRKVSDETIFLHIKKSVPLSYFRALIGDLAAYNDIEL